MSPFLLEFTNLSLLQAFDIDARLFDHVVTLLVIQLSLGFQLLVGTDTFAECSWQSQRCERRFFIYRAVIVFSLVSVLFGLPRHRIFCIDCREIALLNGRLDRLMTSGKRCLIMRIGSLLALIFPSDF